VREASVFHTVDQVRLHRLRIALRVAAVDYSDLDARIKYDGTQTFDLAREEAERIGTALTDEIRKAST
jgi:hypothetical protein